jgi:hypothetical protein
MQMKRHISTFHLCIISDAVSNGAILNTCTAFAIIPSNNEQPGQDTTWKFILASGTTVHRLFTVHSLLYVKLVGLASTVYIHRI